MYVKLPYSIIFQEVYTHNLTTNPIIFTALAT